MKELTLVQALRVLREIDSPERDAALSTVSNYVRGPLLVKLKRLHFNVGEEILELACDHVEDVVFSPEKVQTFRGEKEQSAISWITTIAENYIFTAIKQKKKRGISLDHLLEAKVFVPKAESDATLLYQKHSEIIGKVIQELESHVQMKKYKESKAKKIKIFLNHVYSLESTEEQIERYGFCGKFENEQRDQDAFLRARNRIYQLRKRGREAFIDFCEKLQEENKLSADELKIILLIAEESKNIPREEVEQEVIEQEFDQEEQSGDE